MQYTINHDQQANICTIFITGEHRRPDDSIAIQKVAYDFYEKTGCIKYLVDLTGAKVIGGTIESYQVGTATQTLGTKVPDHRVALLYGGDDLEDQRFLETVVVNRGLCLRVFNDSNQALAWLNE